ncbi:serine hydrolase [Patescibacteria group bacterium]|nr:serine hydrolase [Patescibacteria group bacterium]MBU1759143.1 serine hydrolase [Patescibacteria group bacterium]MBU1907496.1 serine hydrolase [Patescibacteria group bacterium]
MILKAVVQMMLVLSVVEFVPVDGAVLESRAELPRAGGRVPTAIELTHRVMDPAVDLTTPIGQPPTKEDENSLGIVTSAVSTLVYDRASATSLYQENASDIRSIGSITKLMTAYTALAEGIDLDATAAVRETDVRTGGHDYLQVDDEVTIQDLLRASLVGSDNSATTALVRLTGLSQEDFVTHMNQEAERLGLADTTFVDPTGLSARNRSTARDIVRMLEVVLEIEPIQTATTEPSASFISTTGINYSFPSTNELLLSYLNRSPYQIVGGKTGFLPQAGYCMALRIQENSGHDIYVVVLGAESKEARLQEVKGLAQWAFDTFAWPDEV